MAKGSRGEKRSGCGSTAKGELILPNGSKAEFDGELKYYEKDKSITGAQRANLETWEKKRTTAKVEYSICYDDNGNQIGREKRGGKGSVRPDYNAYISDGVGTHNHPRSSDGLLGGTFSLADGNYFVKSKNKSFRASASEGTYCITKGKNFDKNETIKYFKECDAEFQINYRKRVNATKQKYKSGGFASDSDYLNELAKDFNTSLVELHNEYKKGENRCGYTYTLEKRD